MTIAEDHKIQSYFSSPTEFEKLFRLHYSNLCSYANNFLKDIDAAEEIVQELFCNLWKNKDSIDVKTNLRSYLFRAVRNSCLNQIKHHKIKEEYKNYYLETSSSDGYNENDTMVISELEQSIRNAIEKLPPERKKVFLLSRYDGLKYKEIAEKLNISIKTVENQMGKAIKFLREELADFMTIAMIIIAEFIINILN